MSGLRALTGKVNGDGTVTVYATTSTSSASKDQGADPNQLVSIVDTLSFQTAADAASEQFTVLQTAGFAQVLRGVAFAPASPTSVPIPRSALGLLAALLLALGLTATASRTARHGKLS